MGICGVGPHEFAGNLWSWKAISGTANSCRQEF